MTYTELAVAQWHAWVLQWRLYRLQRLIAKTENSIGGALLWLITHDEETV